MEVGSLWVRLGLDKSNYDTGINESKSQASGLGGFIKNALSFTVGQGIFDLLKNGMKSAWDMSLGFNSEMQQSQAAFATLLGSADKAKKMLGDLSNMAASTPFELNDLNKASQTLLGFGVDAQKIMPDIKMLGDVSMGNKEKLQGLALVFAQVQSQGKLMGQDLLQMINNGFNPLTIISKQTGESMAELKDKMSKGAISADMVTKAFQAATSQGGLFYGAMDKQSKTFDGQMSTLKDNVRSTLAGVFKPEFEKVTNIIIPAAIDKVNKFSDAFKAGGLSEAMKTIVPAGLVDTLTSIGGAIQTSFGWIAQHGPLIKTIIAGIASAFVVYKGAVIAFNVVQEVQNALIAISAIRQGVASAALDAMQAKTKGATAAQWLLNAAMDANIFTIIVLAIVALIGALIYLWSTNEGFRNALIGAWNAIRQSMGNVINEIGSFFAKLGTDLKNIWNNIKASAISAWTGISTFFSSLWTGINNTIQAVWNGIKTFFVIVWNGIVSVVMAIVNPFINGITTLFNAMKTGLTTIMEGIKTYLSGVWELIKNIVLGAVLLLIDLLTGNFSKLKSDAEEIFNNLKNAFVQIWAGIKLIFTGALQAIAGFLITEWNGIKNAATTTWNGFKTFMADLWEGIKNVAISAWNGLKTTVINITIGIKNGAISIWNSLVNWFNSLPGTLYNSAVSMFTAMKNGVTSTVTGVKEAVVNGITLAIDWIKALPSQAIQWGKDFIQGLINGIESMASNVANSVKGIADRIKSFLHFSVPDEGPLTDYEEWMPDFMGGLAKGIENNKYRITDAIKGVSGSLALSVKGALGGNNEGMTASYGDIYITIDAKNIKEFQDVINIFMNLKQAQRAK